jgi:type IX secretion system PorP/SprF family membrane protein
MKALLKITTALVILLGSITTIQAQQAPMFTHYMYNTLVVNPAYAGSRDALTITGLHRNQWADFEGAPLTHSLTTHAPIQSKNIGLGLSVMNDRIGPTSNTSLLGHFAYRLKINDQSKLAFGLSGGADFHQANLSSLNLDEQGDPVFENDIDNHITPSFGFGMYYARDRFYAGISVPNLIQNEYPQTHDNENNFVSRQHRHYFFILGALFNLGDNLAFKPTGLLKTTSGAPTQADLTATFIFVETLHLGAMFRTGDSFGGLIGLALTDQLYIGYSYDKSYGLHTFDYNNGSHEIVIRYDFIFDSKKQIHNPRHF